jgi:hypothetical protein
MGLALKDLAALHQAHPKVSNVCVCVCVCVCIKDLAAMHLGHSKVSIKVVIDTAGFWKRVPNVKTVTWDPLLSN